MYAKGQSEELVGGRVLAGSGSDLKDRILLSSKANPFPGSLQ